MSDRLTKWRAWNEMVARVDYTTTSADGFRFLAAGMPAKPAETRRLPREMATRVRWSDGHVEDIPDEDLR